jgi:hypothetical protein
VLLLGLFIAGSCLPAAEADPLAKLSWIVGHWGGEMWGGNVEEIWTAPQAGSMMGMFRFVRNGRVGVYELLAIEQDESGPVLRLRHFGRGLVAREAEPIAMPLKSQTDSEAVFATTTGKRTVITFRRAGADEIDVVLEREEPPGMKTDLFRYKRR